MSLIPVWLVMPLISIQLFNFFFSWITLKNSLKPSTFTNVLLSISCFCAVFTCGAHLHFRNDLNCTVLMYMGIKPHPSSLSSFASFFSVTHLFSFLTFELQYSLLTKSLNIFLCVRHLLLLIYLFCKLKDFPFHCWLWTYFCTS